MLTVESVNKSMRRYWSAMYVWMPPLLVLLAFNTKISRWVADSFLSFGIAIRWPTVSLVGLGVDIALLFAAIFLTQKRYLPKCPACSKMITPNMVGIVIATKHCPKCGKAIVSSEP